MKCTRGQRRACSAGWKLIMMILEDEFGQLTSIPPRNMPMNPANLVPVAIVSVLAFRMYSRVRRNIGRQPLQRKRLIARIVIFAVVTCLLAVYSVVYPRLLVGLGGGLALGVLLALVGLRLTRFEATPEGHFYTPNPYIGVALSLLFVGRLLYRLFLFSANSDITARQPALMQSALSFFIIELLAGYYMAYFVGLLLRSRKELGEG
jgi:MFS family permease